MPILEKRERPLKQSLSLFRNLHLSGLFQFEMNQSCLFDKPERMLSFGYCINIRTQP
jgi:hypothetical protein